MNLTDPRHQQVGQVWASFLLLKPSLYLLLSRLHISVSALAVKETPKMVKLAIISSYISATNYCQTKKSCKNPAKRLKLHKRKAQHINQVLTSG